MKRLVATVVLTLALLAGTVTASTPASAASAAPDQPSATATPDQPVDYVPSLTSYNICLYIGVQHGLGGYYFAYRTIHYGTAHVTQCWFRTTSVWGIGTYSYCYQHVWGVGTSLYAAGFYPSGKCW